ncbi:MAG: hypothetical protein JNJ46_08790 [Myxococcales bacterium]|nr:hypothetical protein [Myxococcales bacterium]
MPRIYAEAPELITSPDGAWAAALCRSRIYVYSLEGTPESALSDFAARSSGGDEDRPALYDAYASMEITGGGGRICFVASDRLLHVFREGGEPAEGTESGVIAAELLSVPDLRPIGPLVRVGGAQRIVGVGPAGAVVAPHGPGADIICLRGAELVLQRTFMRSEVRAAIAGTDRRFLLEQRGGYDVWDVGARTTVTRLVLQTRQPPFQVGYAQSGKMMWALSAGPPIHVELFRSSDGRRMMELDQPGRALGAEAAPSRLVIAAEERAGQAFLDVDLSVGALTHSMAPTAHGPVASFALRPRASSPELLVLFDGDHDDAVGLLRLRLPTLQARGGREEAPPAPRGSRITGRSPVAIAAAAAEQAASPARARMGRSELRPSRSGAFGDERTSRGEIRADSRVEPRSDLRAGAALSPLPSVIVSPELHEAASVDEDSEPGILQLPVSHGEGLGSFRDGHRSAARRRRLDEMLRRSYDAGQGPAAWQWELVRWAQLALSASDEQLPLAPEGGPVQSLAQRLRFSPVAQKILSLLYACEYLLGVRPRGMRVIEIAACLCSLYEEPTLLAELLPTAPLRSLGLIAVRSDGRLRLQSEVARLFLGLSCPDLQPAAGPDRDGLSAGLYGHIGPFTRASSLLLRQSVLRLDALTESQPMAAIERAIERAVVYDAVVVIDGVAGLSFPAFSTLSLLPSLRPLLLSVRAPVLLCSMPDTASVLGLSTRSLPPGVVIQHSGVPAPLVPSGPLPSGTTWRGPMLPVSATFLDSPMQTGRIEVAQAGDRRSAIVIGPSATPEAYATAAYLAARDGAVVALDAELTQVRALVLAMLLRQIPVTVTAMPPGGTSSLASGAAPTWPAVLAPYVG